MDIRRKQKIVSREKGWAELQTNRRAIGENPRRLQDPLQRLNEKNERRKSMEAKKVAINRKFGRRILPIVSLVHWSRARCVVQPQS
jgi:hypothetical protein